jgi:DnaK suppressor protein
VEINEAKELLDAEREGILKLIGALDVESSEDRAGANEPGDHDDPAESLIGEGYDEAIEATLRHRLSRVEAALQRISDGTYGLSVRSGLPISPARLEADPAAELTVEEAEADQLGA